MLGVFGDASRLQELGYRPGVVYRGLEGLSGFVEGVVPLLWVPGSRDPSEGVVDVYGRRYLFAFGNSGCIANPNVIGRALKALERAYRLGYNVLLLDAARLPSPVDGLYFLTTCYCSSSHGILPGIGWLYARVKRVIHSPEPHEVAELLEDLSQARAAHVEHLLGLLRDKASELGLRLEAAVFPYPLSRYVGQEPRILKRYLDGIHVMLYHRCPGPACLNAEISRLSLILEALGLDSDSASEILGRVTGLPINLDSARRLADCLPLRLLEKLMKANRDVYGERFTPILWFDEAIQSRIEHYWREYGRLDLFVPAPG